jgi:hypothetical protein
MIVLDRDRPIGVMPEPRNSLGGPYKLPEFLNFEL